MHYITLTMVQSAAGSSSNILSLSDAVDILLLRDYSPTVCCMYFLKEKSIWRRRKHDKAQAACTQPSSYF